jgi:hypothetical protein
MQAVCLFILSPSLSETLYFLEAFKVYGKRNYEYVEATMEKIRDRQPNLRRPYDSKVGVYPCCSINVGRHTASYPHTDTANLAQSWCSITAIGDFDPKLGGHLVLKELGLVIEFPASSTVLIPSALITHSNVPVREHEARFSIVQYAAGGLFRWVENGFMTDREWRSKATAKQATERKMADVERWRMAASMFTTLEELID